MKGGCVSGSDLLNVGIVILNVSAAHILLSLLVKFVSRALLFSIVLVMRVISAF
jgi:hypothetical protein